MGADDRADDRDMTKPLDVLVMESHPGAAARPCTPWRQRATTSTAATTTTARLPLPRSDRSRRVPLARHTDVALLVRRRVAPRPTALEQGATCAIRAGLPLVEAGPSRSTIRALARRSRRRERRVHLRGLSDAAIGELRREILRLAAPILFSAGIMTSQTLCRIELEATRLPLKFDLPTAITPAVKQALGVRVLDAVRAPDAPTGPSTCPSTTRDGAHVVSGVPKGPMAPGAGPSPLPTSPLWRP